MQKEVRNRFSFVVLGTSQLTALLARSLNQSEQKVTSVLSLSAQKRPDASFDLCSIASEVGATYAEYEDINSVTAVSHLRGLAPDFILSTWPHWIGSEVLTLPRYCVIGTHPTYLPANRGRHPLHWAIVLGIRQMAMSFFRMTEQFDRGPILHSEPFELQDSTINDANARMNETAARGLQQLLGKLSRNPCLGTDLCATAGGNYWRARTIHDVTIDPRLPARSIIAIVRSFCPPYPGARMILEAGEVRIADARLIAPFSEEKPEHGREYYGRLNQHSPTEFTLVCGDGATVSLTTIEPMSLPLPKILHPPTFYAVPR